MGKVSFVFLMILIGVGFVLYVFRNSCRKYFCLAFNNKQNFIEIEKIEDTGVDYKGTLMKGNIRIRLEAHSTPSPDVSERFTQAKIMQLEGLYENARSPYPGTLSNEIVCEDKFKPIIKDANINGLKTTMITGYLNDRLQYGSCLEDQLTYIGKTAIFYCENQKKWYYFEAIAKKSDAPLDTETTQLIQSLKCQKLF